MQPARTVRAELRRNTESSDSENDTADGGKGLAGLNAEEQEELFRDDFSFDIKSDVLGVAYKACSCFFFPKINWSRTK